MITNEWLRGYIDALENISAAMNTFVDETDKASKELLMTQEEAIHVKAAYKSVQDYIKDVKKNYKQIVKEMNDASKSKKASS